MSRRSLGRLKGEDLAKWRNVWVRYHSIQINPTVYSALETERTVAELYRFIDEIALREGVADDVVFGIDPNGEPVYLQIAVCDYATALTACLPVNQLARSRLLRPWK